MKWSREAPQLDYCFRAQTVRLVVYIIMANVIRTQRKGGHTQCSMTGNILLIFATVLSNPTELS